MLHLIETLSIWQRLSQSHFFLIEDMTFLMILRNKTFKTVKQKFLLKSLKTLVSSVDNIFALFHLTSFDFTASNFSHRSLHFLFTTKRLSFCIKRSLKVFEVGFNLAGIKNAYTTVRKHRVRFNPDSNMLGRGRSLLFSLKSFSGLF